jgi:hypothetical protein
MCIVYTLDVRVQGASPVMTPAEGDHIIDVVVEEIVRAATDDS